MQRLDTKHRTELKRVVEVRSHWGPRDLFWHLITEEEEGGCNQGEESTEHLRCFKGGSFKVFQKHLEKKGEVYLCRHATS